MSVHKAISAHSRRQHEALKAFLVLDEQREKYIDQAVQKCINSEDFSVTLINEVTHKIQEMAKREKVPTRVSVSKRMIEEYVQSIKKDQNKI